MRRSVLVLAVAALAAACGGEAGIFEPPAAAVWQTMATWEGTGAFESPVFDPGVTEWRLTLTTTAIGTCRGDLAADCFANVHVGRVHPSGVRYWTNLGGVEDATTARLLFSDGDLPQLVSVTATGVRWRVVAEAR